MGAERRSSREDTDGFEFGGAGTQAVEPQVVQGQGWMETTRGNNLETQPTTWKRKPRERTRCCTAGVLSQWGWKQMEVGAAQEIQRPGCEGAGESKAWLSGTQGRVPGGLSEQHLKDGSKVLRDSAGSPSAFGHDFLLFSVSAPVPG